MGLERHSGIIVGDNECSGPSKGKAIQDHLLLQRQAFGEHTVHDWKELFPMKSWATISLVLRAMHDEKTGASSIIFLADKRSVTLQ